MRSASRYIRKDYSTILTSQIGKTFIQVAYFVLLAKFLGAKEYGLLSTILAAATIIAPFSSMGGGNILISKVAESPKNFAEYWGYTLTITLLFGSILSIVLLVVISETNMIIAPFALILSICVSELVAFRICDVSAQAAQAVGRFKLMSCLHIIPQIFRLAVLIIFLVFSNSRKVDSWAIFLLFSSIVSSIICYWIVHIKVGPPKLSTMRFWGTVTSGFSFSLSLSAQTVYNDADKIILAREVSYSAVGSYNLAYRIIDIAFMPVKSLMMQNYARFFQKDAKGAAKYSNQARLIGEVLPKSFTIAFLVSIILFLVSPITVITFGEDFFDALIYIRLLVVILMIRSVHYVIADAVTGSGFQNFRAVAQIFAAVINILSNLLLVPAFGVHGAIFSSVFTEVLFLITIWLIWVFIRRSDEKRK